ncbi:MAG TPA: multicopper oxidase family protein [Rhodothermales bacterium]|nr:multicopper oxidase family protein [Rhodothermales bacterium]
MRCFMRVFLLVAGLSVFLVARAVAQSAPCDMQTAEQDAVSTSLYCLELVPTPAVGGATATVAMGRGRSPFSVAVTPDGHLRYDLTFAIEGLPDPATLGPYTAFVAWVTTPVLDPVVKLGTVGNGQFALGEVAFNKFLILVTAEASPEVTTRTGKLVLRARSPSSLMEVHDLVTSAPAAMLPPDAANDPHAHHTSGAWPMPPMRPDIPMLPGMQGRIPAVAPFLPEATGAIPEVRPRQLVRLSDGDTLALDADLVRRRIRGRDLVMYGFNGQHPGPLIYVPEKATVVVEFTNHTSWPTAIHWHGIRLNNRFDGVPGVTQEPVEPGGSFTYEIYFRDAGIYWYHPHHREDIFQDLGLYGNLLVRPAQEDYFSPVNREEVLMLDDLLLGDEGIIPYGTEASNFTMMGRFGNVFLVNGEPDFALEVPRGEVVRFFLTNVANTRTFNVSFGGLPIKVIGSDVGLFEREVWAESVVLAPAERYIVEVQFPEAGLVPLMNRVQAVNHRLGQFVAEVDTLAQIQVDEQPVAEDFSEPFARLREHVDTITDINAYRAAFDRPVDHELVLTVEAPGVPLPVRQLMRIDAIYANPVEWSGTMPMMNWISTGTEVRWILRDPATGLENMDIDWRFRQGDVVKLRLRNEREAFHAMQHPVHIHGQRFLVLSVNGVPSDNLVWKDTMLLPAGATADILLDLANPGAWMIHCHIAEHLSSGMKMVFSVE